VAVYKLDAGEYGRLQVASEVADMRLEGVFSSMRWLDLKNSLFQKYLPALQKDEEESVFSSKAHFTGEVTLKKIDTFCPIFCPALTLSNGTYFTCDFNYVAQRFALDFKADTVRWGNLLLREPRVRVVGDSSRLICEYKTDELRFASLGRLCNVRNAMTIQTNRVDNELTWNNWEKETYSGSLSASLYLRKYRGQQLLQIFVNPGVILLADSVWKVDRALILKDDYRLYVNHFHVHRNDQSFCLKGRVGDSPRDTLNVQLRNLDLADLDQLLFDRKTKLFGKVNGTISMSDFYRDQLIHANVEVDQWGVDQDTLGVMEFRSYWDVQQRELRLQMLDRMADRIPFLISGGYKPSGDSLNLMLNLSRLDMSYLSRYLPDVVKEGKGSVSGKLALTGGLINTVANGHLELDSVSVLLTGVNTAFSIHDRLYLKNNRILLDKLVVRDAAFRPATCSGYYDWAANRYDLNVNFENFLILNTNVEQGERFYGQLYISGLTRLYNRSGRHQASLNLRTEENSKLYIPLSVAETQNDQRFLYFINEPLEDISSLALKNSRLLSIGVDLEANLEINDNLEVQIIFDPTVGDILKTVGRGDLKVSLNKDNQLQLFGEYRVERGDYLFTLSNLINKKFVLNPGGSIKWNGSPYDATIDLSATYNLRTSLGDLVSASNIAIDRTSKVPVECVLNLNERLTNPSVKFDIHFPSLDVQGRSLVQSFFASEDDVNKQLFSLLLLNKFYTPDYVEELDEEKDERNTGYQAGVTTASELLSNQLSRWLSQISNDIDIDFSYRPGDQETMNEFELAFSTQLFNNRVTLSANSNMTEKARTNSNTSITGDFDMDVKINKQGTLKLKAYSHTNEKITYDAIDTVQGLGISYQETFDTFRELVRKYFGFLRRKNKKQAKK